MGELSSHPRRGARCRRSRDRDAGRRRAGDRRRRHRRFARPVRRSRRPRAGHSEVLRRPRAAHTTVRRAAPSVARFSQEAVVDRLEETLAGAASKLPSAMRPKVLIVGRTRYTLPLSPSLAQKFAALESVLDVRVLASAAAGSASDGIFTLVPQLPVRRLDGITFWLALPARIGRLLRAFRPDAVVCQTAYDAAAAIIARRIARVPARIVVEVHGDWRTSTRLYGSSSRRVLGRIGDAVAAAALRRADAVRTVSPFTAGLVRELGVEPVPTSRPSWISTRSRATLRRCGRSARALRWRARAVQEHRRSRSGVGSRRGARSARVASHSRGRHPYGYR